MTEQPRITISCEVCGSPMVLRENRQNGSRFLGCSQFPQCRETSPLPAYFAMLEAGAEHLPGFER